MKNIEMEIGANSSSKFRSNMSSISKLKQKVSENLLLELKSLVSDERRLIKEILEYLEEVELRKLYLDKGFSSMFAFCTEFLGYTPQEAMTRIHAMRLSRQLPDVKDQLQDGTLSLSVAAKVQSHVIRENKIRRESFETPLQAVETKKIVSMVNGKSVRDSEKILLDIFPHHDTNIPDKVKTISAKQVRVEMSLSQTTFDKLQKVKALRAHVNPDGSWEKLMNDLCDLALKKFDPSQRGMRTQSYPPTSPQQEAKTLKTKLVSPSQRQSKEANKNLNSVCELSKNGQSSGHGAAPQRTSRVKRSLPLSLKRRVWVRDFGRCQQRDHSTGRICGETFGAQVDHIKPWALGGEHSMENLRVLCWSHNRHRAEKTFGQAPER